MGRKQKSSHGDIELNHPVSVKQAQSLGRKKAMEELPETTAEKPCNAENDIKRPSERIIEKIQIESLSALEELGQERSDLLRRTDPAYIQEPRQEACRLAVEAQIGNGNLIKVAANLFNLCLKRVAALRDKGINASKRDVALYLLFWAVIFAFLLIESTANGYFLGKAGDGWLDGSILALFIASLSIAISFISGVAINKIWGEGWIRRALAGVVGLIYANAIVCYHLIIGWSRATITWGNPETAVRDALLNFLADPFGLPDIFSWGLVLIGLFFAGTAFIAGFHDKDARLKSRYALILIKLEKAEKRLQNLENGYLKDLSSAFMKQLDEIDNRLKLAYEADYQLRLNQLECNKVISKHEFALNSIQDYYTSLIGHFRSSNLNVRRTKAPNYFSEKPMPLEIKDFALDTKEMEAAEKELDQMKERLRLLDQTADDEKRKIRKDYESALRDAPAFFMKLRETPQREVTSCKDVVSVPQLEKYQEQSNLQLVSRTL